MIELAEQINSHVEVIDMDNPTTDVAPKGPNAPEVNLALTLSTSGEFSSISPAVAQGPASWMHRIADSSLSFSVFFSFFPIC